MTRRVRWRALLVTLGLLIAQGPMLAHLLLVRHMTCEHGELVEEPRHASRSVQETTAEDGDDDGHADHANPGGGGEAEHDHCDALALRHQVPEVGIVIGPASLLAIDRTLTIAAGAEQRPVPLLSLAPKGSPPAV